MKLGLVVVFSYTLDVHWWWATLTYPVTRVVAHAHLEAGLFILVFSVRSPAVAHSARSLARSTVVTLADERNSKL